MTVNLHDEVVSTKFDDKRRMCIYTMHRDGRSWTIEVPLKEFEQIGMQDQRKAARQNHLRNKFLTAMKGPSDEDKANTEAKALLVLSPPQGESENNA